MCVQLYRKQAAADKQGKQQGTLVVAERSEVSTDEIKERFTLSPGILGKPDFVTNRVTFGGSPGAHPRHTNEVGFLSC